MNEPNSAPHFADQAPNIDGYRELSPEEIALVEEINAAAEQLRGLVNRVNHFVIDRNDRWAQLDVCAPQTNITSSLRWTSIGITHLQEGVMALRRAVCAPTTF